MLVALAATSSCDDDQAKPPAKSAGPVRGKATPLPDGSSDAFGPLPETVAGFRVTRGAAPGYVPDLACKECHEQVYETYQAVGMARSFYRPDIGTAVEKFGEVFHHERTGYRYVMTARDGKYFLKRYCADEQGTRFAEFEAEVAWIMGSGNNVRSYLSQNARGELFQLPLSWYRGKGLAMSPGYDRVDHERFERVIERGCMFCHNAYPEVPVGSDLAHRSHTFPTTLPHGIGCQRCHGPGARHVEIAQNEDATDEEVRKRILNPAHLTAQQREDLCMSCHLQPESVRSRMMPWSFSRPMYSFTPGQDLTEYITFLDHGSKAERRERFEINHHAYRLRQSRCYEASAGRLSCTTCHDPHRKIAKPDQPAHYRKKCAECHEPAHCKSPEMGKTIDPATSDCVSCHMPRSRPSDVVHVTVTDHFIRRSAPARDLTAPREEESPAHRPLAIVPYFPERHEADPLYPVYEGFGVSYYPTEETNREWRRAFDRTRPHTVTAYVNVGRGLLECGAVDDAIALLNEAVSNFADDAPARWTLGSALLRAGHVTAAIAELERARTLDADDPGILGALGDAYWQAGARTKARTAYERALAVRPNSWKTWQNYGYALQQLGEPDDALRALQRAIALNPRDAYSWAVSATLLESQGRIADSFRVLRQGATLSSEVELDLVAALLQTDDPTFRDPKDALERARRIVGREPENGRGHLHLAFALLVSGDRANAARSVDAARRFGGDSACCTALWILGAVSENDRESVRRLLDQLQSELAKPSDERLRPTLVARLRSLGVLPR